MGEPVLDIRALTKSFGALVASDNVSLTIMPGEIHALIGPNGAGKSTLIKQIMGELAPDSGQVLFNGQDVSQFSAVKRARAGMARSFQVSAVAPEFSVLQNAMLAVQGQSTRSFRFFKPAMKDRSLTEPALEVLKRVGLEARANQPAGDLSHGQRRQLEIALALALKPRLFLLDEPMAGMGPEGGARLTDFLSDLRQTAPILLVEHDMDAVFSLADRISVLVYGRIIASGTVAEIRANPQVREAYLGAEAGA
ncbi:ABC transporter ATP-binding protein [Abyssibius alkaniclasticus]|uniref:ABC transporter ATP-binding protein n=1 Tax=Abyssibius alkaniclasticus TaxID=2881234 RepID=UPI0023640D7B|nr:ABC transporter ATP-binding protein [Abyssibius alkaniclasticus]UPH70449.1 ABC transporter ATP-binding protein [Abyssibius alkaniclasticus]